jgi:hypothetical protein
MERVQKHGMRIITMVSVATAVLFATGWGSAVAAQVTSVFVSNTSTSPVPVQAVGTVPTHEQGTANVNVTNTSLPVHEQGTAAVHVDNNQLSISPAAATGTAHDTITLPPNTGTAAPFSGDFTPVQLTLLTIDTTGTGVVDLRNGPSNFLMQFGIGATTQTLVLPFAAPLTADRIGLLCFNTGCSLTFNAVYR